MSYSKEKNVLFIHIPKCAGKSFEVALNIASREEVEKYVWRSFPNKVSKYFFNLTRDKKAFSRLWGMGDISLALQHLTFAEIKLLNLLPKSVIESSIKVAIIRNPYDRVVSSYKHMGGEYSDFKDFCVNYFKSDSIRHNDIAHKRSQIDFLRDVDGRIIIDNLIRFENLAEDYFNFLIKNNIDGNEIPHIGKQNRKTNYRDYYCKISKKVVEEIFSDDIEQLGYRF